ncbi:M14 family zinc carboxypeptidase [Neobacillus bataviensis]|uniref:M14 family zinc carboxypeptidase n=1 Tax=Neobacillus bataviensis TaxID=220685 RepID=UPI001CBDC692|nr:M14 family zinc carboxypeptidase [Neobacillus bataviensis]
MKKILINLLLFNLLAFPIEAAAEETVNTGEVSAGSESVPGTDESLNGETSADAETPTVDSSEQSVTKDSNNVKAEVMPAGRWVEENGVTYYYIGEEKAKGWMEISGQRYYFDLESGALQKGFFQEGEQTFYLDGQTGAMQLGWVLIDGKWYYFNPDSGAMQTGWIKEQNIWYYLDETGVMQTGWLLYQNQWYFLNKNGAMATGWVLVNNQWYYLKPDGAMQTGWLYYQNNWYYLKASGAMANGWLIVDDGWYYFYSNGIMAKNTTVQGYTLGSNGAWVANLVNPKQAYSYNDLVADINKFQKNFPGFIKTQIIGKSVDGRNIYAIKLGKGDKEIFLNGSHHAREHMTTNVLMEMLDQYASSYSANRNFNSYNVKALLNKVSIWFVPMVNPDGVMLVQEGRFTAKNPSYVLQLNGNKTDFSSWKANIRGVDLNRQYPADWANIAGNTGKPSPENFKGYQPLSEPEVQAVYNFTKAHQFKVAVAYHSSGRILYWNFHQAKAEYDRDYKIAVKYSNLTGYSLVFPGPNPSGGGFTDWFIQDMKMPGFTPEISTHTFSKPVPLANFDTIWKENQAAGLMLAQEALNL